MAQRASACHAAAVGLGQSRSAVRGPVPAVGDPMNRAQRAAGVVLHPTSLPGPHGAGDFGPHAHYFVDWLHTAGQTLWQTLPLGPVGPGYSPYMGSSAFAGNPLLVAFEPLVARGWLDGARLQAPWDDERIDYPLLAPWRLLKLREAFAGYEQHAAEQERA